MPDPPPAPIPPLETSVLPGTNSLETDIPKAEAQPKANLSEFSLLLTSIVTLYVGEDRIKYYAHESTLCKLPFFRAALQGQFKEALEKAISMPEDDPEAVSALIRWLYTEKYLFSGNKLHKATLKLRTAPETPSESLLQGLFHLEVYIVASKYDCSQLLLMAREEFFKVQKGMDDLDILRLYRAKGTIQGLALPLLEFYINDSLVLYSGRVRKWVNRLYKEHSKEMKRTALESPQLISDLLQMSVMTDFSG